MDDRKPAGANPSPPSAPPLDAHAFAEALRASHDVLWLIAVSIVRNAASADDAVQESAMIGLRKLEQYQQGTNFTAWMGQIVRNVAMNRSRKERRLLKNLYGTTAALFRKRSDVESDLNTRTSEMMVLQETVRDDRNEIDRRILSALDDLSDIARACLLLRTIEGLSYAEISQLLGIPEGTAMSHVHRTRRSLRERLA